MEETRSSVPDPPGPPSIPPASDQPAVSADNTAAHPPVAEPEVPGGIQTQHLQVEHDTGADSVPGPIEPPQTDAQQPLTPSHSPPPPPPVPPPPGAVSAPWAALEEDNSMPTSNELKEIEASADQSSALDCRDFIHRERAIILY